MVPSPFTPSGTVASRNSLLGSCENAVRIWARMRESSREHWMVAKKRDTGDVTDRKRLVDRSYFIQVTNALRLKNRLGTALE